MACDLQHNVRALMVRASSPMPVSDGHDVIEVPSLFTVTTAAPSTTSSQRVTDYATEPGSGDRDIPEKWQQSEDCPKENASLGTVHEFQCTVFTPCIEFLAISSFFVPMLSPTSRCAVYIIHIYIYIYI